MTYPGEQSGGGVSDDALIRSLEAAARRPSADPDRFAAEPARWPADVAAALEDAARAELLPLAQELRITADWLASSHAARDVQAAISTAVNAVLDHLRDDAASRWVAIQLALIVNLRAVRTEPLFWALPAPAAAPPRAPAPADAVARVLPAFRAGLLAMLKDRLEPASTRLADACRDLATAIAADEASDHWQQAAQVFGAAPVAGGGVLGVAVKRLATRLEASLRRARAPESDADAVVEARVWQDLESVHRLMMRLGGRAGMESAQAAAAADAPEARISGDHADTGLKALGDAFLWAGRYDRWIELRERVRNGEDSESVLRGLTPPKGPAAAQSDQEMPAGLQDQLARAESALRRLENEATAAQPGPPSVPPAGTPFGAGPSGAGPAPVAVDEALLENLNLAAAEIRGARSRAEANLGSLRGGLQDMERTIKALRSQLEAMELDSSATDESGSRPGHGAADGAPSGLGALSRGIDELQGLQDALHALTEETESVLASQASEDSELEHGLLKTRLVPLRGELERWTEAVGAGVRLDVDGGGAMLERRQAVALSDALVPLLVACVSETGTRHMTINISRPRFDLLLEIRFEGASIAAGSWAACSVEFEKLGAYASRHDEGFTRVLRIAVPGPPQSMDVVLVDLGGQRFALPVEGVAGVVRRPPGAAVEGDADGAVAAEGPSLAVVLGVPERPLPFSAEPTSHVLIAIEPGRSVACRVDAVRERERVLVRSPGPLLVNNPWIVGVIVNERTPPTLVLDLGALVPALTAMVEPA